MNPTDRKGSIRLQLALATTAWLITASLLIGAGYLWFADRPQQEVDRELRSELQELQDHYQDLGPGALAEEVARRVEEHPPGHSVYLYAESQRTVIEGTLPHWPEGLEGGDEAATIPVEAATPHYRFERQLRMVALTLDDRRQLAVGRDISEHLRFQSTLQLAAVGALGLVILGGLAVGLGVSRSLLGRVVSMRDTIGDILAGRRGARVGVGPGGDEFDQLADQFNHLLDANEQLLLRMREVTDDVAHDLRTPLSRMRGRIEAALAGQEPPEEHAETLHALLEETDDMLDTFSALLHIAQIESRSVQEHMETLDLDDQARDAADLYQPVAEEAGLDLQTELEGGLRVRGNRHLISQALTNLLDNAVKYSHAPGEIRVTTRRAGERAELCVSDQGPGIPETEREHVLQRFVRLDSSRGTAGTGLGLSFVAAVATLHDANLRLEDNEPGLRITMEFPLA
ncbi:HAMP domain-containing histidine kinase [Myxococcota bacterium]|nr:HAMP domain-containing histidine kinase [Myxococcota bacterium]